MEFEPSDFCTSDKKLPETPIPKIPFQNSFRLSAEIYGFMDFLG